MLAVNWSRPRTPEGGALPIWRHRHRHPIRRISDCQIHSRRDNLLLTKSQQSRSKSRSKSPIVKECVWQPPSPTLGPSQKCAFLGDVLQFDDTALAADIFKTCCCDLLLCQTICGANVGDQVTVSLFGIKTRLGSVHGEHPESRSF
jgi:hypothetical protein